MVMSQVMPVQVGNDALGRLGMGQHVAPHVAGGQGRGEEAERGGEQRDHREHHHDGKRPASGSMWHEIAITHGGGGCDGPVQPVHFGHVLHRGEDRAGGQVQRRSSGDGDQGTTVAHGSRPVARRCAW